MTRFYGHDDAPGFTPTNLRGTWDDTASLSNRAMKTTKGAQALSNRSEATATTPFDVALVRWVSDGLVNAGTIKGSVNFCMMARESNADADFVTKLHIYVTAGDTDTVRGTLLSNHAESTEWSNALSVAPQGIAAAAPVALSPVTVQAGDRIVVEMGYRSNNSHTTSRNGQIQVSGGGADATQGAAQGAAPWIDIPPPDATRFYLTRETAPITPTANGAWDDATPTTRGKLQRQKGVNTAANSLKSETSADPAYDALCTQQISGPLAAQTITGTFDLCVRANESAAGNDMFLHVHVWVTQGDTSTARGVLISDYIHSSELSTTAQGVQITQQTVSSVAVQAGDRLVVEIGYRATNTSTSSLFAQVVTGGNASTDLFNGDTDSTHPGWCEFGFAIADTETRVNWQEKWYLGGSTEDATGIPPLFRGAWDSTSGVSLETSDALRTATPAVASSTIAQSMGATTINRQRLLKVFVSPPLNAGTITTNTFHITGLTLEDNADPDIVWCLHAYLMAVDGEVRATLLNMQADATNANEFAITTATGRQSDGFTMPTQAITQDDRLVLEVGCKQLATPAANRTATIRQGGTGADAAAGDTDTSKSTWFGVLVAPGGGARSQAVWVGF
jgi:hypothetical protein